MQVTTSSVFKLMNGQFHFPVLIKVFFKKNRGVLQAKCSATYAFSYSFNPRNVRFSPIYCKYCLAFPTSENIKFAKNVLPTHPRCWSHKIKSQLFVKWLDRIVFSKHPLIQKHKPSLRLIYNNFTWVGFHAKICKSKEQISCKISLSGSKPLYHFVSWTIN